MDIGLIMLRDYDLNLLTVFDAVMTLGSVNKAADKLNMTSAAVSQNLSRLRDQVGNLCLYAKDVAYNRLSMLSTCTSMFPQD